jgi:hypothetical protein
MIGISTKTAMIATIPITRATRNPQRATQNARIQHVESALPHVMTAFLAGCSCVVAVALKFLSVGAAIEARSIA